MKKPSAKFYHILETIGALMFLTGTTLTFIGVFNIKIPAKLSLSLMGIGVIAVLIGAYNLKSCLLYTSDAADERSIVDFGGRRIIKKTPTPPPPPPTPPPRYGG